MAAVHGYIPADPLIILLAALILGGTVLGNLAIGCLRSRQAARIAAWALVIGAVVGVEELCVGQPPGFRMLAIIGVALWAMKAVVLVEARETGLKRLSWQRWCGFVSAWPGMQPKPFAAPSRAPLPGAGALMALGLRRLCLGLALVHCGVNRPVVCSVARVAARVRRCRCEDRSHPPSC